MTTPCSTLRRGWLWPRVFGVRLETDAAVGAAPSITLGSINLGSINLGSIALGPCLPSPAAGPCGRPFPCRLRPDATTIRSATRHHVPSRSDASSMPPHGHGRFVRLNRPTSGSSDAGPRPATERGTASDGASRPTASIAADPETGLPVPPGLGRAPPAHV